MEFFQKLQLKRNVQPPSVGSLSADISYDNVDISTGIVKPTIPLFTIGNKDLFEQISLDYVSSSGIKVNAYASDIGLGWGLNAGGYIVREVRGLPDDAMIWPDGLPDTTNNPFPEVHTINGQSLRNGWLDYANWGGSLTSPNPNLPFALGLPTQPIDNFTTSHEINDFAENFKNGTINYIRIRPSYYPSLGMDLSDITGSGILLDVVMDGQPDIYYYKCPGGYSGKFIFDKNGTPTPIPYNPKIKISPPIGPMANNQNQWVVTVENGTKFYFPNNTNYYEKTTSETSNLPRVDDSATTNRNEGIYISEHISKWYISRAESITGNKLDYVYVNEPDFENTETTYVQQDFHVPGSADGSNQNGWIRTTPPSIFYTGYGSTTSRTIPRDGKMVTIYKKRLSKIDCSNGSKINFTYNGINRLDVKNQKTSLGAISLEDKNDIDIMTYSFNQSLFNTPSVNNYNGKRLKLESIDRKGKGNNTDQEFYQFDYYETYRLPERNSSKQDFWGYYNSNTSTSLIPALVSHIDGSIRNVVGADRSPNVSRAKASVLRQITFPTGGTIEYDYELNDFKSGLGSYVGDWRRVPTGGLRIKSITKNTTGSSPIVKNFVYRLPDSPDISSGQIPIHLRKWKRNGAGRLFEKNKLYNAPQPYTALYITRYSYPKYLQASDLIRYSHVTVDLNGTGKTEYEMTAFDDQPDDEKLRIIWEPSQIYSWEFGEQPNPNEIYPSSDFITFQEHAGIPGSRFPTPPIDLTDKSYLRGLMLNIKEYKENSSTPIRETTNTYAINPNGFEVKKIFSLDSNSRDDFFGEPNESYSLNFDISSHDLDLFFLEKTEVKEVGDNGGIIQTSFEYIQDNEYNVVKERKLTNSDSSVLRTKMYYPFDSEVGGLPNMIDLISQNRITELVKEESYNDDTLISKKQVNYDTYNLENGNSPALPKSLSTAKGNNALVEEYLIIIRDEKANIVEYKTRDDVNHTTVWGYNKTVPIARIENATRAQVDNWLDSNYNKHLTYLESLSNADSDDATEDTLRLWLDRLRVGAANEGDNDTMVTTYTHDPLIGVTSMTNPHGYTIFYEYDEFNRLKAIRDADENLIEEYEYNYNSNQGNIGSTQLTVSVTYGTSSNVHQQFIASPNGGNGPGTYSYKWYKGIGTSSTQFESSYSGTSSTFNLDVSCQTYRYIKLITTSGSQTSTRVVRSNNSSCDGDEPIDVPQQ